MSARKRTKQERAASRKRKESAAKRDTTQPLKPIDMWAMEIVECYDALVRAGYGENESRWFIEEKMRLPDWLVGNPNHTPFEDDEDDEDE